MDYFYSNKLIDSRKIFVKEPAIESNTTTYYVMIDSSQRNKEPIVVYDEKLYSLPPYSIEFIHDSSLIRIHLPNHNFDVGDNIILNNVVSKNVILNNVLMIKKNSSFLRIFHPNHGLSYYGRFDPTNENEFLKVDYVENLPKHYDEFEMISDTKEYFILKNVHDLTVELSGIKGIDYHKNSIGNIPINFLNKKHPIHLIFTKDGTVFKHDPNHFLIKLDKKCSINYADGINPIRDANKNPTKETANNTIYIKYHHLFGIPLKYLNCEIPETYLSISEIDSNYLEVDIGKEAIVDPNNSFFSYTDNIDSDVDINRIINSNFGGGSQAYIRKIIDIINGYRNPNDYLYQLDRSYSNVSQVKIIGSNFPNSINSLRSHEFINNRLYWKNIDDGDHIYYIEIEPGNYSLLKLKEILENEFCSTLRFPYKHSTDAFIYDDNGHNKYHIVDIDISEETNTVSLSTFKEILLGPNDFKIPDNVLELYLNVNSDVTNWLIYLTPRSHPLLNVNFPFTYYNLYRSEDFYGSSLRAILDSKTVVLINFYRRTPSNQLISEVQSINTTSNLLNVSYDYSNKIVHQENHSLDIGTIIITDKFVDTNNLNNVSIYEITKIIDSDNYVVKKYPFGKKLMMIYDDVLINHPTISVADGLITNLISGIRFPAMIKIHHPNHYLTENSEIIINSIGSINRIPKNVINQKHKINKVINANEYLVYLDRCDLIEEISNISYNISIKYPDMFQLLFNYPDTLGKVLGFTNLGENSSITPFNHCIRNKDKYLNSEIDNIIPKLSIIHHEYFYICSPELGHVQNTKPVSNVFAIGQWTRGNGVMHFNNTLPTTKVFNPPLKKLDKIHFTICHPDGHLIEFNGADHSFIIEITEENSKLN